MYYVLLDQVRVIIIIVVLTSGVGVVGRVAILMNGFGACGTCGRVVAAVRAMGLATSRCRGLGATGDVGTVVVSFEKLVLEAGGIAVHHLGGDRLERVDAQDGIVESIDFGITQCAIPHAELINVVGEDLNTISIADIIDVGAAGKGGIANIDSVDVKVSVCSRANSSNVVPDTRCQIGNAANGGCPE